MKLEGRTLQLNSRGDDVRLLHADLRQLGFTVVDLDGVFGSTTFLAVQELQKQNGLPSTGRVDRSTARVIDDLLAARPRQSHVVKGAVLDADGTAVVRATVRVFEKRLRSEARLGEATTGAGGSYEVAYPQPTDPDLALVVRAFSRTGAELAVSPVLCKVRPEVTVNLVVGADPLRGPSEYMRIHGLLAPLLVAEEVEASNLTENDVRQLASRHDLDAESVEYYVASARLHRETDIAQEAFYGWLRQRQPTDLAALVAQPPEVLRSALEASVRDNIVSRGLQDTIPELGLALQQQIVRIALRDPQPGRPTFATMFEVARVERARRERILEAYVRHEGSPEEFWRTLRADQAIPDREVDDLQHTVRLGVVTLNHTPLIAELMRRRRDGSVGPELRDLSGLSAAGWRELLETETADGAVGAPPFFGSGPDGVDRYAAFLPKMVESIFPTAVLARRLEGRSSEQFDFSPATTFLQRHPGFEFRDTALDAFLEQNPDALAGMQDGAAAVAMLEGIERLFDITPPFDKADAIATLLPERLDSALAIRRMGPTQFIRRHSESLGGAAQAQDTYSKAARKADTAMLLFSQSVAFNPTWTAVIPPHVFGPGVPDLEDLFGSLDLCHCQHCNSIHGPAAYFVEILHFLMNRPGDEPGRSALDVLFERRSDLGEIELTCDNTNTPVPHVDLVNEILEHAVAPGGAFPFQTTGDAAALAANPEHVNVQAYSTLAAARYPIALPFDLFGEEARIYLNHIGVPRHTLMAHFAHAAQAPSELDVAAEYLAMSPVERQVVVGSVGPPRELWGFTTQQAFNSFIATHRVAGVLARAGLGYDDLVALLDVRFVNPDRALRIRFAGSDCDLGRATITGLNAPALDRINRFIRLQRTLPWSTADLDAILRTLDAQELSDDTLLHLAGIKRLTTLLRTRLATVLSWWSIHLDTEGSGGQPSLYSQVFRDPTVHVAPDPAIFELNAASPPDELLTSDRFIQDHAAAVYGALGIDAADLDRLVAAELPDGRLNLTNLTRLYRAVTLARALGLSIGQFLSIRAMSAVDPFGHARIAATELFVERSQRIRTSAFTVEQLDCLLRDRAAPGLTVPVDDAAAVSLLSALREGLRRLALDHQLPADPDGSRTMAHLSLLLPEDTITRARHILFGTSREEDSTQQAFIEEHFARFMDPSAAVEALVGPGFLTEEGAPDVERRIEAVLAPLLRHLQQQAMERLVIHVLAAGIRGMELPVAEQLLRSLVPSSAGNGPSLGVFLAAEFIPPVDNAVGPLPVPTPQTFPDQFATLRRLSKVVMVLDAFRVPAAGLNFFMTRGPLLGWLNPNELPLAPAEGAAALFEAWVRTVDLFEVAGKMTGGLSALFELLASVDDPESSREQFVASLSQETGWGVADVGFLLGAGGFDPGFPADFRDGQLLVRMAPLAADLARLGIAAAEARQWSEPAVTAAVAAAAKQAARARYGEPQDWAAVARPLRDALREQQRAVLTAFLVHDLGFRDPDELYAHFLVDVQMDPCMQTSRIVLATASVQLFVHRCLLNLEDVDLSAKDAEEWAWMKNYRVWEAARKIFLYPENWIRPELRDDRTPLFRQLEAGLLQDEINDSSVTREYRNYLTDLSRVAHLEVVGLYRQWEVDADILHVLARTRNLPRVHYYRRWVDRRYWTAWERVDVEIQGSHVVPVVWKGRLYVFWPTFQEKAVENTFDAQAYDRPLHYYEVRLSWSEHASGRWCPVQSSAAYITTEPRPYLPSLDRFSFWSYQNASGELLIGYLVIDRVPGFTGATPGNAIQDGLLGAHFKVSVADGEVELQTFPQFLVVIPEAPPGMTLESNAFRKSSGTGVELITSGRTLETFLAYRYLEAATRKTSTVLGATPSGFSLVTPHATRPFVSQAPFFYQDVARTFLVVPRGTFVGGVDTGTDLTLKINFPPLELPDAATGRIAEWMTRGPIPVTPPEGLTILTVDDTVSGPIENRAPAVLTSRSILQETAPAAVAFVPKYWEAKFFRFDNFYHPYVPLMIEQLNRHGIDGLLRPDPEKEPQRSDLLRTLRRQLLLKVFFWSEYQPNQNIVDNVREITGLLQLLSMPPLEEFDFSFSGAYSIYNWELFFHVPFVLATRLTENQRFAEAHRWFHYIFDPTYAPEDPATEQWPDRVWQIRPFFEYGGGRSIARSMLLLKSSGLTKQQLDDRQQLVDQIEAWRKSPFNPHLLARLRPEAYMKAVVMAYLDNVIAWADHLFRRDTRESINEATQLYVLAAEVLGERPQDIKPHGASGPTTDEGEALTFNDVRSRLDAFSNALVELETRLDLVEAGSGGSGGIGGLVGPAGLTASTDRSRSVAAAPDLTFTTPVVDPPDDNPAVLDLPLAAPIPAILGPTLLFCIPRNDKLLGYWDTVADRLFKIRHCMNIEGIVRELPLFEPPIDPGLLVKAAAAGADIAGALSDMNAPLPHVRFVVLVRKATELITEVKALSATLLSALEKKDAEALSQIRAGQEIAVLELTQQVREKQHQEAVGQVGALQKARQLALTRYDHYERLLGNDSVGTPPVGAVLPQRPRSPNVRFEEVNLEDVQFEETKEPLQGFNDIVGGIERAITQGRTAVAEVIGADDATLDNVDGLRMLREEKGEMYNASGAQVYARTSAASEAIAADLHEHSRLTHSFSTGVSFILSNSYTASWTEKDLGSRESATAAFYRGMSAEFAHRAGMSSKVGHVVLREHEWTLQSNLASREIMHIDQQLAVADVRIALAEKEIAVHQRRIRDAREVDAYLQSKVTSADLYTWMAGRTSDVYLQSYQLAYDLAKRAERAFRHELGLVDSAFIRFGYWDNLKKGLLSGEQLFHDLKRMEVAYTEQCRREYEVTQHFSLALLSPASLLELRETGSCEFELPELAFDISYPGQYMRRVKSARLTVPCVTGPNTNVSASLTLLQNRVRISAGSQQEYAYTGLDDPKFRHDLVGVQAIATSSAQGDSGLFQLVLDDERYLPFEGAGAISRWRLSLPALFRQFDYGTISDVVLHLSYTAREGGDAFRARVNQHVADTVNNWLDELAAQGAGLQQLLSLAREFPNELHRLSMPAEGAPQSADLRVGRQHFPFFLRDRELTTTSIALFVRPRDGRTIDATDLVIDVNQASLSGFQPSVGALLASQNVEFQESIHDEGLWRIEIAEGRIDAESLQDLLLLVTYQVSAS